MKRGIGIIVLNSSMKNVKNTDCTLHLMCKSISGKKICIKVNEMPLTEACEVQPLKVYFMEESLSSYKSKFKSEYIFPYEVFKSLTLEGDLKKDLIEKYVDKTSKLIRYLNKNRLDKLNDCFLTFAVDDFYFYMLDGCKPVANFHVNGNEYSAVPVSDESVVYRLYQKPYEFFYLTISIKDSQMVIVDCCYKHKV